MSSGIREARQRSDRLGAQLTRVARRPVAAQCLSQVAMFDAPLWTWCHYPSPIEIPIMRLPCN